MEERVKRRGICICCGVRRNNAEAYKTDGQMGSDIKGRRETSRKWEREKATAELSRADRR